MEKLQKYIPLAVLLLSFYSTYLIQKSYKEARAERQMNANERNQRLISKY